MRNTSSRRPTQVLRAVRLAAGTALIAQLTCGIASAASVADFYKGKDIRLIISSPVGGGYNRYARTVARHLGDHIPGKPRIIAQNMPGAGGIKAANYLYNVAPKDGSVIGSLQNTVLFEPLYGNKLARFDPLKFNWIGSANSEVALVVVWHTAPVKTIQDLMKAPITVGATGAASTPSFFGRLLNTVLGTKMRIINGYKGMSGAFLAMEDGEVQGFPSAFYSSLMSRWGRWVKNGKVRILVQVALKKHPALPDVPLAQDLVKSQADKDLLLLASAPLSIGRPNLAPPGTPSPRVAALRAAFNATLKDPSYIKDAKKQRLETGHGLTGQEITQILSKTYSAPKAAIARMTAIYQELQARKKASKKKTKTE